MHWDLTRDGDERALQIFSRHYTFRRYKDNRRDNPTNRMRHRIVGPGEYIMLIGNGIEALFVWKKFRDPSGQQGVCCSVFRNESNVLSSDLILEAEIWAMQKWPGERMYTMVNPKRIRSSNPGYCFLKAGWSRCGTTRGGHIVLEKTGVRNDCTCSRSRS